MKAMSLNYILLGNIDLVRLCKAPDCLPVFSSRQAVISVIDNSKDKQVLIDLAARIAKLPNLDWAELTKLIQLRVNPNISL